MAIFCYCITLADLSNHLKLLIRYLTRLAPSGTNFLALGRHMDVNFGCFSAVIASISDENIKTKRRQSEVKW